jgi:amino acid adenylation domain-containing protein
MLSLSAAIDRHACERPDALALRCFDEAISYRALKARVNAVAHALCARGIAAEARVAVYHGLSIDFIVALLGVMKAGGAFVPIDTRLPRARVDHILKDAAIELALCAPELAEQLPRDVAIVSPAASSIAAEGGSYAAGPLHPDRLAYVVYTSGSTGLPKGVCVTHRGLRSYLDGLAQRLDLRGEPRLVWSFLASPGADLGFTSLFGALHQGHTLQLVPQDMAIDAERIAHYFRRHPVDVMKTLPTYLSALLTALPDPSSQLALLPRCKLILGGEALLPAFAREILALGGGLELVNHYGPSETTIGVLAHRIQPDWLAAGPAYIGLGEPIGEAAVDIVRDGRRVDSEVEGELLIRGASLARGYWNRPDLTADRFRPDPYSDVPGARLYHSGDLMQRLPGAGIVFRGRIDRQIKIRGYRVEVTEVERQVCLAGGFRHAVVRLAGTGADARLVAFVAHDGGDDVCHETFDEAALQQALRDSLPDYMVPSRIVLLDAFPLNANGKIDHASLPEPDELTRAAAGDTAPEGALEQALAAIWTSLLRIERIGAEDDVLALGGHSLLFAQAITRVREQLGKTVPYPTFFTCRTIRSFARAIERLPADASAGGIPVQPRGGVLQASFSQESLWFLHQSMGGGASYNLPIALHLRGRLRYECLVEAINAVVARHESLRTNLVSIGGEVRLRVRDTLRVPLPLRDLGPGGPAGPTALGLPEIRQALVKSLVQEEADRPFDLCGDPLIRASLLRLAEDEHVLAITLHHVISDGWSDAILLHEISARYSALVRRERLRLPPLAVHYTDYAAWQRARHARGEDAHAIAYWTRALQGAPGLLNLVTDRPRPVVPSHRGARLPVSLDAALGTALGHYCRSRGVTPFMVLLAGYKALLWRHSGQTDIVVGSPVANRRHSAVEGVIGLFINSIALRSRLDPDARFEAFVDDVKRTMLEAYEHQEAPFEKVVEAVNPVRSPSHSPLFQTMFALQNMGRHAIAFEGLQAQRIALGAASAKFDLSVILEKQEDRIVGCVEYATELFDAETIEEMMASYRTLLAAALAAPATSLRDLPLLRADEASALIAGAQVAPRVLRERSTPASPEAAFLRAAAAHPQRIAVRHAGETLSYRELHRRASRVARALRLQGIGMEDCVGILMDPSCAAMVAMLGVMLAGAAYLPLLPKLPADRLAYILDDSKAALVITATAVDEPPVSGAARWLTIGELDDPWFDDAPDCAVAAHASATAYVIYTSGSTGRPKGVCVPRAALTNLIDWHLRAFDVRPEDKATQLASFVFDAAVWECWPYLVAGAELCIVDPQLLLSPEGLRDWMLSAGITIAFMPTPLADTVLSLPWPRDGALRRLLVGGERLTRYPDPGLPFELVNNYGPTENAVVSTSGIVRGDGRHHGFTGCPTIGTPVDGCQAYVLDERLRPVPIGIEGELYLGGASLARGYTRADLTAASFVPHPFARTAGERLYRTGDMVRQLRNGEIEYLGRRDRQVKIRGFRIELGEIETALAEQQDVAHAVVLAAENDAADRRLVAFVTRRQADPAPQALADALRGALREVLPAYMVPSFIHVIDAMPRTLTGKVDMQRLAQWAAEVPASEQGGEAAATDTERRLLALWRRALANGSIGAGDNFFAVGGDSIVSVRLVGQCREAGFHFAVADLFRHQTVRELAAFVDREAAGDNLAAAPASQRGHWNEERAAGLAQLAAAGRHDMARIEAAYPLTALQSSMLRFAAVSPAVLLYRDIFSCRFAMAFVEAALRGALAIVARRHDVLRTGFLPEGLQAVQRAIEPVLAIVDLSDRPPREQRAQVHALHEAELAAGFDLAAPPLWRVTLIRLGPQDARLTLAFHHAILDGWSAASLMSEIVTLHGALSDGDEPAERPSLPFADAVFAERALAAQPAQRAFWQGQLRSLRVPGRAMAYRRLLAEAPGQLNEVATWSLPISADALDTLETAARRARVPLKSVLLAAHIHAQAMLGFNDEVVTGVVSGARSEVAGADEAMGLFLNTVPFRLAAGDDPFETARRAFRHEQALLPYQRFPLAEIEALHGGQPLFETKFNYTCFRTLRASLDAGQGAATELEIVDRSFVGLLANFNKAHAGAGGGGIDIVHNTRIYSPTQMDRVASAYQQAMASCLAAAQALLAAEKADS